MTDRPIIFSGSMVRALLEGRKTQTRRLTSSPLARVQAGDRLWVRENLRASQTAEVPGVQLTYDADGAAVPTVLGSVLRTGKIPFPGSRGMPSIHMPRWASRLTLLVTEVRVQRLHEMSAGDAEAEGVEHESADPPFYYVPGIWPHSLTAVGVEERGSAPHAVRSFAKLWAYLHGPGSWDANPEVAALTFQVTHANIDTLTHEAAA